MEDYHFWFLRLRFWRAPPSRIARGSLVKYVVVSCDEHGDEVAAPTDVTIHNVVKYDLNNYEQSIINTKRTNASRWSVSFHTAENDWNSLEIIVSTSVRPLDIIGLRTGCISVDYTTSSLPLLRCIRDFDLTSHRFEIIEEFGAATGAHVWNGSICLALYLCTLPLDGVKMLELGAGCGLVSLLASSRGANVLATEHSSALSALQNNCGSFCRIEPFDFSRNDSACLFNEVTLVVAADVLYAPSAALDLAATLQHYSSISSFIIAHTQRPASTSNNEKLAQLQAALINTFPFVSLCTEVRPRFGHTISIYKFDKDR